MKVRRNAWFAIAILSAVMGVAQVLSGQALDMGITQVQTQFSSNIDAFSTNLIGSKHPNDPSFALRNEMQTFTSHTATEYLQDEVRSLRRQLKRLTEANAKLQASNCSCPKQSLKIHATFRKPEQIVNSATQSNSTFSADPDLLLPMIRFGKRNVEQLSQGSRIAQRREHWTFFIVLIIVALYIIALCSTFLKVTAEAKFRRGKQRSSRNAALDYWNARRAQEKQLRALREERHQLKVRREMQELKKQKAADAAARKQRKNTDTEEHEQVADTKEREKEMTTDGLEKVGDIKEHEKDADAIKHEKNADAAV